VNQARLTVLSGPTAVGKGTVVTRLIQLHPEIFVSISVTTRHRAPARSTGCITTSSLMTSSMH
jgi:guanylate kinase